VRTAAAASIGTFGILTDRAKGAEFTYKFANNQPVNHPMNVRSNEMAPKILAVEPPTPTLMAMSSSVAPALAASNTCARLSLRTGCVPALELLESTGREGRPPLPHPPLLVTTKVLLDELAS
jgi:hypothetical protein